MTSRAAAWLMATRPRTLTAAAAPVIVGTAVAASLGGFRPLPALAALIGALLIQIGTNLANDYYDFVKGADTAERVGPTRVTQAGLVEPIVVKRAMIGVFALATLVGAALVSIGGWPIVVNGLLSIASGVAYTGGPFPLGYNGLGDLFVFVFFGLVAVAGTTYVQTLLFEPLALAAAVPVGALATAVIVVNNLRDADTDARANKNTLAVRFGRSFARREYMALLATAFAAAPAFAWITGSFWHLLPLAALPLAFPLLRSVFTQVGAPLNATLGATARLLVVHAALFAAALVLARPPLG
jgi:1,4-dihydroxy-2-naphthoate octaprenyltransferase